MVNALYVLFAFFAGAISTLIYVLLFTCKHDYELRIHKIEKTYDDGMLKKTYWIYTQTCKHCGKIKVKTIGLKD